MFLKKNQEIISELSRLSMSGKSDLEKKPTHVIANIFDVDPDTEIYKIMQFKYFKDDVSNDQLTHIFPSKDTWGDPYENLLLTHKFKDDLTGQPLYLTGIVSDLYATCWTMEKEENIDHWESFSRNNSAVRIKSTPKKLLSSLMNINDKFFSLHHYMGRVIYEEIDDLFNYFADPCWEKHLDNQGQGAALALMRLQEDLSFEQEVRLVYQYNPNDNQWVRENVIQYNNICKVPMIWSGILDEIIYSKSVNLTELNDLINKKNIQCPIIKSDIF
ncbi:hypothetical protein MIB43_011620 [Providencia rettgeri]|uniref:hypothetical protein n=1 Tax=Providencia rettgeri TaxID=587 RepID=UPI001F0475E5|nr:hypothetical protein [Providencia rettgeri]EJD6408707.1 hypothetical protein [Providencia rettgeri]MCG9950572.1 hypothetical protein [Providencia rettgeri]